MNETSKLVGSAVESSGLFGFRVEQPRREYGVIAERWFAVVTIVDVHRSTRHYSLSDDSRVAGCSIKKDRGSRPSIEWHISGRI